MEEATLIYLWTRDGQFPVNQETEDYIEGQLTAIKNGGEPVFSDTGRAEMAKRIVNNVKKGVKK